MTNTGNHAPASRELIETELFATERGAIVQVVSGDLQGGTAEVADLLPATVKLTDRRVVATAGGHEWSWLLGDIERVSNGGREPWSILAVPGVDDHGVAVPREDLEGFRATLRHLVGAEAAIVELDDATLPLTLPVDPRPEVEVEVEVEAEAESPVPDAAPASLVDLPPPDPQTAISLVDLPPPAPGTLLAPPARVPAEPARVQPSPPRSPASAHTELAGLDAREISAWFGTHHVLDRISLMMEPGEVTALIGPSGCGKSTFLRILNRMHEMIPSASLAGEVRLDGVDIYDPSRKLTDARRQIGMVFQKPNPFPAMSIYDNVVASYQLTGTKVSKEDKDAVVEETLSKAGLWNEVKNRLRSPGGGLSGGQQQRLCIARALAIRPRVLLMDEPCSALDPTSTRRIEQTILELADEVTIVIVTHNMQQAARVSHQCAFFLAEQGTPGVIVEHGPTDDMFSRPQDERTSDYVNGRFG